MSERALTIAIPASPAAALIVTVARHLAEAREIFGEIHDLESRMMYARDLLLARAHALGRVLTKLKEEVGHGKWLRYLEGQWPEMSQQNAARFMAFFDDNSNHGNSGDLTFTTESIRKFMWGYIPVKERPQLAGDEKVPSVAHHLTVVNHLAKWDRQLKVGHVGAPPVEQMRRDFQPAIELLAQRLGRDWLLEVLESLDEASA